MQIKIFVRVISMLFAMLFTLSSFAAEKLIFAIDLIRHGDRTPIHELPKSTYNWPGGLGNLTTQGLQQGLQLGSTLRKKYVEQYGLLPALYTKGTLYVRSTDTERTIASAKAVVLGLYPLNTRPLSTTQQDIPINIEPKKQDQLLVLKNNKNIFLLLPYKAAQNNSSKLPLLTQAKLTYWSKITGLQLTNIGQLKLLGDILYIRILHHISLPKGISQQDAATIVLVHHIATVTEFRNRQITYPTGHAFLTMAANYFKQAIEHKTKLKYVLISAHDSTIMSVMNTLGTPVDTPPPYASDLNFSLFQNENGYYIKVNYNNKDLTIPACDGPVCSLRQFFSLVK